ncbi:MAG: hypothetical protein ABIL49_07740 [candidate division WOR-3 bacterium]|jgi:spoIIIJ-associated protein
MEFVEETDLTVERALKKALEKLKADINEVKYVILKKDPVVIRVYRKTQEIQKMEELLKEFLEKLGTVGKIQIIPESKNVIYINIKTKDLDDVLIGRDGKNLDELGYLLGAIFKRKFGEKFKFIFDVSNYKKRRESYVVNKAIALAKLSIQNKLEYTLDPLKGKERRLVIEALRKMDGIEIRTVGKGKNAKIVIVPK